MADTVLQLCDLTVAPRRAGMPSILSNASVSFSNGDCTVILGPNGAGKSVLLRAACGLMPLIQGRVVWTCPDRAHLPAFSLVFQKPVMLRRSALDNVAYPLLHGAACRSDARVRALAALTQVGLAHLADRPARVLSGGEQQRVALARALVTRPAVLLLDEPTASLDPASAMLVESIVRKIHASGVAVIWTTHRLGEAKRLAKRVLFVDGGRVVEDTPADQFFTMPASSAARAYLQGESA